MSREKRKHLLLHGTGLFAVRPIMADQGLRCISKSGTPARPDKYHQVLVELQKHKVMLSSAHGNLEVGATTRLLTVVATGLELKVGELKQSGRFTTSAPTPHLRD